MNWKDWEKKRIFVLLKTGSKYSGVVKSVDDDGHGLVLITILDKFAKLVCFASGEVVKIEEVS